MLGSVTQSCACLQDGWSCLHVACEKGHVDVAKLLCEVGGEQLLMLTDNVRLECCSVVCCGCKHGFPCVCTVVDACVRHACERRDVWIVWISELRIVLCIRRKEGQACERPRHG